MKGLSRLSWVDTRCLELARSREYGSHRGATKGDPSISREAFKSLLPLYSLKAAAGYFGKDEAVEPEGWVEAGGIGRLREGMFVAQIVGRSMEPRIHDGDFCVFRVKPAGTRLGKIVLVQYRGPADPKALFLGKNPGSRRRLAACARDPLAAQS